MNPVRPSSSYAGAKSKKQLKNKFRCQQQGQSSMNNVNSSSNPNDTFANEKDKCSPIKVKEFQDFAGISSESIKIYARPTDSAEQTSYDQLSEEACDLLTEDINYKLRYIIHVRMHLSDGQDVEDLKEDCLVKGKLQGRDAITADDVEETFSNLNIDRVYGAPSSPNWLPVRQQQDTTLYQLEDQKVNLIELAEKEYNSCQEGDILLDQVWLPTGNDSDDDMEEYNETFTEYFETMCEAIISDNEDIRHIALADISTNSSIGPITDSFYHFSYFLLMKDLTYDRLTMRALHLLEVLENSPLPSLHVYAKQLKLLVRLLLQRLLISSAREDIIKHMCYVLSLFCLRTPLKNMVLNKVENKLTSVCQDMILPLLNIVYYIGLDAIKRIFLPNLQYFLIRVVEEDDPSMTEIVLAIYGLLCQANLNEGFIYDLFREVFSYELVPYYRPKETRAERTKREIETVKMRLSLIKTRRKVDYYRNRNLRTRMQTVEEAFDIIPHICSAEQRRIIDQTIGRNREETPGRLRFKIVRPCCSLRQKMQNHRQFYDGMRSRRDTQITVGKTSLLLSVLKPESFEKCYDHSLLIYSSL